MELLVIAACLLCAPAAAPLARAAVTLTISGTYTDTFGESVFGITDATIPFSYQITYDPALDTNTNFFPVGSLIDGQTTVHDWYGYSASGIVASDITLGTATFTAADLQARFPSADAAADLWFDTDISQAAPTRAWAWFQNFDTHQLLQLGESDGGTTIEMVNVSQISDEFGAGFTEQPFTITSSVPEPGELAPLLIAVVMTLTRKRSGRGR